MQDLPQEAFLRMTAGNGGGGFFGFSLWGLAAGIVFSTIGFFYLKTGKRDSDFTALGTGLALMVFPYFVTKTLYIVLIGAGILLLYHFSDN